MATWDELRAMYGSESNPKHEPMNESDSDDSDNSDAYKRGYQAGYDDGFTAGESEGEDDTRQEMQSDYDLLESMYEDYQDTLINIIRMATEGAL